MSLKSFSKYVEDRDQDSTTVPDSKPRNGLADPDPGELRKPHKPDTRDLDLAKQAVQLIMGRSAKWHRTVYRFFRKCGDKIPEVGHLTDHMNKPKDYDKLFGPRKNDVEPDILSPSSADSSPAFYQK